MTMDKILMKCWEIMEFVWRKMVAKPIDDLSKLDSSWGTVCEFRQVWHVGDSMSLTTYYQGQNSRVDMWGSIQTEKSNHQKTKVAGSRSIFERNSFRWQGWCW